MPRFKKKDPVGSQGTSRKANVFHDSTNTKKAKASEPFRKEELNTAAPQLDHQPVRPPATQEKVGKALKYPDSATPKIDNRNKQRWQHQDDVSNFVDKDQQQRLTTLNGHLFPGNEIEAKNRSFKTVDTTSTLNKKDVSSLLQIETERSKLKTPEEDAIHRSKNSQKRTESTTRALNKKQERKETPSTAETYGDKIDEVKRTRSSTVETYGDKIDEVKRTSSSRNKAKVSSKTVACQDDNTSFDNILRGPHQRAPTDAMGRPVVTKETLKRAFHSQVDNAPVLKAMLDSCRTRDDSERVHRMDCDGDDQKSTNLVSLSTAAFDVKVIDTAKSCSESVDGSDLTLLSSDDEVLELPPGWIQKMSRSKNKPYYVHPDHGRTWYCPALIRRRKRRKITTAATAAVAKSSDAEKSYVIVHAERRAPSAMSKTLPIESTRNVQDNIHEPMDESDSYEHGAEESSSPNAFPSSHEDKESNSPTHQTTWNDEVSPTASTVAPGCKSKSQILLWNEKNTEQSHEASSPELETYVHRQKNAPLSNAKNTRERYDSSIGENSEDDSASMNSQTRNPKQLKSTKTSTESFEFDDDHGYEVDFNQGNDSPMAGDDTNPSRFPADDDSEQHLENSASSEEGQLRDRSFEMDDDDSSRWISYPSIPRCSLQYLHKLVHA